MSDNVFADMGLANPEERQLKAELVLVIRELVADAGLTQSEIGDKVGMTQPAVSRLLKGMTKDVSVGKLLSVVNAMGNPIRIVVEPQAAQPASTSVEFALKAEPTLTAA